MAIPVNASNRYQKLFKKRFLSIFCILFLILVLNVSGKKIDLISSVKDKTQQDGFDENKQSSLKSDQSGIVEDSSSISSKNQPGFGSQPKTQNWKFHTQKIISQIHQQRLLTTCTIPECTSCVTNGVEFCVQCQPPKIPVPFLLNACVAPSYASQIAITNTCTASNCVSCAQFTIGPLPMELCIQCQPGYRLMLLEGVCMSNALFVQSDNGIRSYGEYFYSCLEGCLRCEPSITSEICYLCKKGYALNELTFSCVKCSGNCQTCNYLQPSTCLTCPVGFVLAGGRCLKCSNDSCISCKDTDQSVCTSCKNSFNFVNETCVRCGPNCKTCSTQCTACNSGFMLVTPTNASAMCVKCTFGCFECTSLTSCAKCYPGFYQNAQKACIRCEVNCRTCSSDSICTSCLPGYDLFDASCVRPIPNCVVRNNNGTCRVCKSLYQLTPTFTCEYSPTQLNPTNIATIVCGMGLFNDHYWCQACQARYTGCTQCTSQKCVKCQEGYYVTDQTNTCVQCSMTGCKSCQSENNCLLCQDGYFMIEENSSGSMVSQGYCRKCDDNCRTCDLNGRNCLSCNDNFTLNVENNCEGAFKVGFKISLNFDFESDSSHLESVRDFFVAQLPQAPRDGTPADPNLKALIKFTKIYRGSTVVEGYIDQPSQETHNAVSSSVSNSLANTRTIGSIEVVSVTVNGQQVDPQPNNQPPPSPPINPPLNPPNYLNGDEDKKSNTLAVALGVTFGVLGLLLILIVGFYIWKKKKIHSDDAPASQQDAKKGEEVSLEGSIVEQKSQQKFDLNEKTDMEIHNNSEVKSNKSLKELELLEEKKQAIIQ